jgi:hypothetical protein
MAKFNIQNYINNLKNPNKKELQSKLSEFITDTDLSKYDISKENIIEYNQLADYNTIEQLLPRNKSYKIILIEEKDNSGHWVCVLRYKKTIEFFNSYANFPSLELSMISPEKNLELGQDKQYLNILLTKALGKFNVIYNKVPFQKLQTGVNTCGKWVILRILMLTHYNYTLAQFIEFMKNLKKNYKLDYDELVSLLIVKDNSEEY